MEEIFKKVFQKYNPTDDQVKSFVADFTTGLAISLLMNTNNLTEADEFKVDALIKSGDMKSAMDLLETKFGSREEWERYVESQTLDLFQHYIKTVVPA